MDLISFKDGRAHVELTDAELAILNNALNEACNGLDLAEFATRMGVERDEVQWLLRQVRDVLEALERGE